MSKSKLEELFEKERAERFKMTGLDWEPARCDRELLPTSLDAPKFDEQANYRRLMADYKRRFNMDSLQVEGIAKQDDAQSLADRAIDAEKARLTALGSTLRVKTTTLRNGSKMRWWFELSI